MADEDDRAAVADAAAMPEAPSPRGVAPVPPDSAMTGRIYMPAPDSPPPVFVDESGRRGRLLGLLGLGAALIGLVLLVAFWWSQLAAAGG